MSKPPKDVLNMIEADIAAFQAAVINADIKVIDDDEPN